jgi:diguanylate cyclase (GGDEF)-like protein/PAS domain S-box-containing protein
LDTTDTIAHWRTRIFSSLLSWVLILSTVTAIPSIVGVAARQMWSVVAIDLVGLLWLAVLWWFDRIPYTVRVLNFLALIFLIGVSLLVSVGPVSQIYLFASTVLAAVLLGLGPALVTLALAALVLFVLGCLGYAKLHIEGLDAMPVTAAAMNTLNFMFVGAVITVSCSILLLRLSRSIEHLGVIAESLQRKKDRLQAANAELRLTGAAVARLNDLVIIAQAAAADGSSPIIFANDAFEQRTGYGRAEVLGRDLSVLLGPDPAAPEANRVARALLANEAVTAELRYLTKAGDPYWVEIELVPFADEGGNNTHWVAVGRDITERKKSENHIHRLAYFDGLTGLPNRRLLMERMDELLAAAREGCGFGALLFIDLDRFKYINDARGHAIGDALLQHAAARLADLAGPGDTVARIGGDEFVVLLSGLGADGAAATGAALAMADRVRCAITETFHIEGQTYSSSASIGVAMAPKPGQTAHDLLREADTAMYRAKVEGRNRIQIFEATMRAEVERRLTLERDLAAALSNGELFMHLQLQVDYHGTPAGAELLARWRRADGSMVPPDQFIPVAEECGLIQPLGEWALREACASLCRLSQAGFRLPLSVNVSPSQFRQPDFVEKVRAVLAETGAPANLLIFEVTEGLLIESLDDTLARMHELTALGIRLSIDDFGTGYSSLAYLKRMPLYELKIDRSFIRDTPFDANGTAIVQSILAMAGHLGLRVIAEGVETTEQAGFLAANGTTGMQGYLFAKPVPLAELIALLGAHPSGLAGELGEPLQALA